MPVIVSLFGTYETLDGPLAIAGTRRDRVEEMAADLVRFDAFRNEADAIRSLFGTRRYESFEIMRFIDDARQLAMQTVVAKVMGES